MKKLIIALFPVVAGCATPQSAPSPEVVELRAEVRALKAEMGAVKNAAALRSFQHGKRVAKPKDLRRDLPKGVAR